MIFAYMRIAEDKITHFEAYHRADLRSKQMGNKNPNGNILVDTNGNYNRFDGNAHKEQFPRLKGEYAIGDPKNSRMLDDRAIRSLAPSFVARLSSILGKQGKRAIDIISRGGRQLDEYQTKRLLSWLSSA
jgi:hypothetical protein